MNFNNIKDSFKLILTMCHKQESLTIFKGVVYSEFLNADC